MTTQELLVNHVCRNEPPLSWWTSATGAFKGWLRRFEIGCGLCFAFVGPALFAQQVATPEHSVVLNTFEELGADTIAFTGSGGRVIANYAVEQNLVDRVLAPTESDFGVLVLGADTAANLNFAGKGDIRLGGVSGAVFSGQWTPDGVAYGIQGSDLLGSEISNSTDRANALMFDTPDTLVDVDETTSRHLVLNHSGGVALNATNGYTGGTQIAVGRIYVGATSALGSGEVDVRNGGALLVSGAVAVDQVEMGNEVVLSRADGGYDGGILHVTDATVSGTVSFLNTGLDQIEREVGGDEAATLGVDPVIFLGAGSEFSGTLEAAGGGRVYIGDNNRGGTAVVSGNLNLAVDAGVLIFAQVGSRFTSDLTITAGNGIMQDGDLGGELSGYAGTFLGDVTFASGSYILGWNESTQFVFGGEANAMLQGASVFFDPAADEGYWNSITGDHLLMQSWGSGSISGMLTAANVFDGYEVSFSLNEASNVLTMSIGVSAIPEPSTYAAWLGAVVLALAGGWRRSRANSSARGL